MKKILMLMLAMASLLACKKNHEEPVFDEPADQAMMTVELTGANLSRVGGLGDDLLNNTIKNYTVFVFDKKGKLAQPKAETAAKLPLHVSVAQATDLKKNVFTNTNAAAIYVVANAYGTFDPTTPNPTHTGMIDALMKVTTLAELRAIKADYTQLQADIEHQTAEPKADPIIMMSGQFLPVDQTPADTKFKFVRKTIDGVDNVPAMAATVKMDFVCSKVMMNQVVLKAKDADGNITVLDPASYELQKMFVISASKESFIVKQSDEAGKESLVPEDFATDKTAAYLDKLYLTGVDPRLAPAKDWLNINAGEVTGKVGEYRNVLSTMLLGAEATPALDSKNHFYLFENDMADEYHPTIVVCAYKWIKAGHPNENQIFYLPVAFSTAEQESTVTVDRLNRGTQYKISMNATIPTDVPVGTDDPTITLLDAVIELTVEAATWKPVIEINKDFE